MRGGVALQPDVDEYSHGDKFNYMMPRAWAITQCRADNECVVGGAGRKNSTKLFTLPPNIYLTMGFKVLPGNCRRGAAAGVGVAAADTLNEMAHGTHAHIQLKGIAGREKGKQHEINVINFKHRDDKLLWDFSSKCCQCRAAV